MEKEALIKIEQVNLIPDTHKEIPVPDLSSLGAAGSSVKQFVQSIAKPGGEGIYKVTFPNGFKDMTLSKFNGEDAYLGSGMMDGSFKQARLNQISCDPTQMFVAMALMSIQSKLNEIQETQQEILNFMFDVQEAKLAGNLQILNDAVDDYKQNSDNETFKKQMLTQVGNIKREASQGEKLYEKQIRTILDIPNSIHMVSGANKYANKLRKNLRNYHLAFYIRSYAEFLEVFLIGNFSEDNLSHLRGRFLSEGKAYSKLYTECYTWAEKYLHSAIGKKIAPLLKGFDGLYEKGLNHLPGCFGRFFKADAEKYEDSHIQLEHIQQDKEGGTTEFVESLIKMVSLQKGPVDIYFEDGKLYIAENEEGTKCSQ